MWLFLWDLFRRKNSENRFDCGVSSSPVTAGNGKKSITFSAQFIMMFLVNSFEFLRPLRTASGRTTYLHLLRLSRAVHTGKLRLRRIFPLHPTSPPPTLTKRRIKYHTIAAWLYTSTVRKGEAESYPPGILPPHHKTTTSF